MGNTSKRYSAEAWERQVRLYQEHLQEYPTRRAAKQSTAGKIGCSAASMRLWVMRVSEAFQIEAVSRSR